MNKLWSTLIRESYIESSNERGTTWINVNNLMLNLKIFYQMINTTWYNLHKYFQWIKSYIWSMGTYMCAYTYYKLNSILPS